MNYSIYNFKQLLLTKYFNLKLMLLTRIVNNNELLRLELIKAVVNSDPVVMNITLTSDIVDYNKLKRNNRTIFVNNIVRQVSDKQSFIYNPNNTKYV